MASLRLQPPPTFNFHSSDEWPRWKRRFELFGIASGLSTEGGQKQVRCLYCMGENAEDTLLFTGITSNKKKRYQTVVDKFNTFFKVRRNVIFERVKFNHRIHEGNETIEQFISSLFSPDETCDYGNLTEEMMLAFAIMPCPNVCKSSWTLPWKRQRQPFASMQQCRNNNGC